MQYIDNMKSTHNINLPKIKRKMKDHYPYYGSLPIVEFHEKIPQWMVTTEMKGGQRPPKPFITSRLTLVFGDWCIHGKNQLSEAVCPAVDCDCASVWSPKTRIDGGSTYLSKGLEVL
jgi:hypothetical protein